MGVSIWEGDKAERVASALEAIAQGGGGGTDDYEELDNKPSINNVTLVGNKTLSDLGVASASDLSAKYTKPQDGIPASDLASGVIPTVHNVPAGGSAGQVLTKTSGTDYEAGWATPQVATDAQVAEAVDDWLGDNVAQETGYVLDRTLLLSNAAAPADLVGTLKNAFYTDLYGGKQYIEDYKINASRKIVAEEGYCVTDYFEVTGGTAISISCNASSSLTLYGLEYDADKNIIDRWGIAVETRTFNLTANAKYFRFTFTKGYAAKAVQNNIQIYTADVNGAINDILDNVDTLAKKAIYGIGFNKFNPATTENGYIQNNAGQVTSSDTYFTSDFIDVSKFTNGYAFSPKARKICFYDENKNSITSSYIGDETQASVLTLNSAYKYMRLSFYYTSTNIIVADSLTVPTYQPYEIIAYDGVNYLNSETTAKVQQMVGEGGKSSQIATFLNGKTVLVFGDSIMHGAGNNDNGIADLLSDKYGTISADYSVSGATMGVRTDDPQYTVDEVHHIAKQVRNAIAASVSPDLIIFDGGTNDIGGEIPIGTMSEVYTQPSAENYFANGFETVAYLLMKNFVGVPIIYMRAHNMSSRSYAGQVSYGELGNQIAEKWGIRIVDMYKRMNTQLAEYRTAYLADYTHPNAAGYNKYYIPAIEDFVFDELVN